MGVIHGRFHCRKMGLHTKTCGLVQKTLFHCLPTEGWHVFILFALPLPVTGAVGTTLVSLELPQPIAAMGKGFFSTNLSPCTLTSRPWCICGQIPQCQGQSGTGMQGWELLAILSRFLGTASPENPAQSSCVCRGMGSQLFILSFLHLPSLRAQVPVDTCTRAGKILSCSFHTVSIWICVCRRQLDSQGIAKIQPSLVQILLNHVHPILLLPGFGGAGEALNAEGARLGWGMGAIIRHRSASVLNTAMAGFISISCTPLGGFWWHSPSVGPRGSREGGWELPPARGLCLVLSGSTGGPAVPRLH